MSCDVGKATEAELSPTLENELILQPFRHFTYGHISFSNPSVALPTSQLILQPFRCFNYVTPHSPSLAPSLYLRSTSFFKPSVASPTSQLILQPFFRFSYDTGFSLTSPGEPPMQPPVKLVPRAKTAMRTSSHSTST